ncbi:MAG: prepilin peptidase [Ruminococcus sp.]|nr:prepilin peptidase [Ruminococcus sp.]
MDTQLMIYYTVMYIFVFLFGACIGSFLNVCIYRLPTGESLIKRNSHCMTCGEEIKHRDLIPIVSWCLLKGKCRNCGAKISPRYTVVELLNAVLYLLVFLHFDIAINPLYASLVCLMFSALIVVFFMDWDTQLINTYVVIFIALLAIPEYFFCQRTTELTLKSQLIGAFIVSVPLLIIVIVTHEKAMGMGDVYLMAAAGLFLGMQGILVAMLIALIVGSICGLILKRINGDSVFAFGPYLSIGIAVSAIWGKQIGEWYMNFTGLNETLAEESARLLTLF